MRWIKGIVAFTAALVLGTFAASFFVGDNITRIDRPVVITQPYLPLPSIDLPEAAPAFDFGKALEATKPQGITVAYTGMEPRRQDENAYLKFVVYNGTSGPLTYGAQAPEWPFPDVRVNGLQPELEGYRCGSGMRPFVIDPGASAEFRVGHYEFEKVPAKRDLVTAGFYLRESHAEYGEAIFSEPFVLPNGFRQAIDQWKRDAR